MPIMEPQFQRKVFFKPSFIGTSGEFLGIPGFKDIFPPLHPTKGFPTDEVFIPRISQCFPVYPRLQMQM